MSLFLNVEQNYQFWKVMVSINLRIVCQKQTMSRPRVCQDERVLSMQHFGKLENLQEAHAIFLFRNGIVLCLAMVKVYQGPQQFW